MPLSDIVLASGDIIVTETTSQVGLFAYDAAKLKFGYVEQVYSGSDKTTAGDYIMFNPEQARDFIYGSTRYYLIKEDSVSGKETILP